MKFWVRVPAGKGWPLSCLGLKGHGKGRTWLLEPGESSCVGRAGWQELWPFLEGLGQPAVLAGREPSDKHPILSVLLRWGLHWWYPTGSQRAGYPLTQYEWAAFPCTEQGWDGGWKIWRSQWKTSFGHDTAMQVIMGERKMEVEFLEL